MAGAKKSRGGADQVAWVGRQLGPASLPSVVDPAYLLWTPLHTSAVSRSYMTETNGGGSIEVVPGLNRPRAVTAGLAIGQPTRASGMIPQGAAEQDQLVQVPDTTKIPWRSICQLLITRQDNSKEYGTAW